MLYHLDEAGGTSAAADGYGNSLILSESSWLADNGYDSATLNIGNIDVDRYTPSGGNPNVILQMISNGAWFELEKAGFYDNNNTSKPLQKVNNTNATYENVIWFRNDSTDSNMLLRDIMLFNNATTPKNLRVIRR